jgi:tRNA(fMet)-specific endonuclease VapC
VARQLILDTAILIAVERDRLDLRRLVGDDDPAIASITAAELLVGVENASPAKRDMRALLAEELLSVIPIKPYNLAVARMHAILLAWTKRNGQIRSSYDLIIAATAGATGCTIITTDRSAKFDERPGVKADAISLS